MQMESGLVQTEIHDHVSVISLHRRDKKNAFDLALTNALNEALDQFEEDPDQWVAVLTGGRDMFSAGSDLKEGSGKTDRGGEYGIIRRKRMKPIVAAAEGLALGGGMEILFCCDVLLLRVTSASVCRRLSGACCQQVVVCFEHFAHYLCT